MKLFLEISALNRFYNFNLKMLCTLSAAKTAQNSRRTGLEILTKCNDSQHISQWSGILTKCLIFQAFTAHKKLKNDVWPIYDKCMMLLDSGLKKTVNEFVKTYNISTC